MIEECGEVCGTFVYELGTARSFKASMGLPNQAVLDSKTPLPPHTPEGRQNRHRDHAILENRASQDKNPGISTTHAGLRHKSRPSRDLRLQLQTNRQQESIPATDSVSQGAYIPPNRLSDRTVPQ